MRREDLVVAVEGMFAYGLSRAVTFGRTASLRRHAWRCYAARLRDIKGRARVHEVPFFGDLSQQGRVAYRRVQLPVVQSKVRARGARRSRDPRALPISTRRA